MNKLAALFAALPLAACVSLADAGALVDISVLDRSSGQRLEVFRHQGRLYVAGTPGNRYAVMLHNKSAGRVLTVVSVDGVNALSGQTAATSQSGYVLSPSQSAEISGWRKSMDDVAAFYFTSVADSYAGRTDRPQNVGVIGVAVYRRPSPSSPPRRWRCSRASVTMSALPRALARRPPRRAWRRPPATRRRSGKRSLAWVPVTASESARRPNTPSFAAPANRRRRSSRSITTAARIC